MSSDEAAEMLYRINQDRGTGRPASWAAGAGVGGSSGWAYGCSDRHGNPRVRSQRYEGRVKDSGILLSVHSDDSTWTKKAKEILDRTGAQDVSSTGEATADKDDKARVREVA
jgi:hypothetical protein